MVYLLAWHMCVPSCLLLTNSQCIRTNGGKHQSMKPMTPGCWLPLLKLHGANGACATLVHACRSQYIDGCDRMHLLNRYQQGWNEERGRHETQAEQLRQQVAHLQVGMAVLPECVCMCVCVGVHVVKSVAQFSPVYSIKCQRCGTIFAVLPVTCRDC